jgi:hypothetical protein
MIVDTGPWHPPIPFISGIYKMIFGSRHERFVPADKKNPQLSLDISVDFVATGTITSTQKISYIRNTVTHSVIGGIIT